MTDQLKQMLSTDVQLKQELFSEIKKQGRRQTLTLVGVLAVMAIVIIGFLYYFTKPTKADILVFRQIQAERALQRLERDSLRVEKEIFHGLKKQNPYSKPKYDTIK